VKLRIQYLCLEDIVPSLMLGEVATNTFCGARTPMASSKPN